MGFLQVEGKTILVMGVANRKSVAFKITEVLESEGAKVIHSVRSDKEREAVAKLLPGREIYVCNVEREGDPEKLALQVASQHPRLHGFVHSIAFANYMEGLRPFHETKKKDFLQAVDISCFSLVAVTSALKDLFEPEGAVVTISISTTTMAAEGYGFMAPVKAALNSSLVFLAKSFSTFSKVRFNAVCAGLLKTSSSAAIPGYVDNYLYAEKITLRRKALQTEEVANTAAFLLSPRSSGINAQGIVVDAGMAVNYFDKDIVKTVMKGS